jgi:hypothetical protein
MVTSRIGHQLETELVHRRVGIDLTGGLFNEFEVATSFVFHYFGRSGC